MPLIWQRLGTLSVMDELADNYFPTLAVALFQNDFIPTDASVLADFTEANFVGYAPQSINTPNPAFLNGGLAAEVDADLVTFTQTGGAPQRVYGYFVYDPALVVVCAQRFPASILMTGAGASLDVGVKFTGKSQFNG